MSAAPVVAKINYAHLESLMSGGEKLYTVKNTLRDPFIYDWNLELLPADLGSEFDKYLEKKYVEYGVENMTGKTRTIALFEGGKTINFLHSFLTSKKFPVVLPRPAGKEEEFRSSFVLNAGKEVIVTEKQAESLRSLEKIKRVWGEGEKREESSWLGYLIISPIQSSEDLLKYSMSYVTSEDTYSSAEQPEALSVKGEKTASNIVKAKS